MFYIYKAQYGLRLIFFLTKIISFAIIPLICFKA